MLKSRVMTMSISLTASAADDERPPKWHNKTTIYRVTIQFNSGPSVEAYEHWGPSTPAEFEEKKFRYIGHDEAATSSLLQPLAVEQGSEPNESAIEEAEGHYVSSNSEPYETAIKKAVRRLATHVPSRSEPVRRRSRTGAQGNHRSVGLEDGKYGRGQGRHLQLRGLPRGTRSAAAIIANQLA